MSLTAFSVRAPSQNVNFLKPNSTVAHSSTSKKVIQAAIIVFCAIAGLAVLGCMTAAIIQSSVILGAAAGIAFFALLGGGAMVARPSVNRRWNRGNYPRNFPAQDSRVPVGSRCNNNRRNDPRQEVLIPRSQGRVVPGRSQGVASVNRPVARGVPAANPRVNPGVSGRVVPGSSQR